MYTYVHMYMYMHTQTHAHMYTHMYGLLMYENILTQKSITWKIFNTKISRFTVIPFPQLTNLS